MPDIVSIIAGGWSAGQCNLFNVPGISIGVNDAVLKTPCEACVSMDRLWIEDRFVYMTGSRPAFFRRSAFRQSERLRGWHNELERNPFALVWLREFDCNHETNEMTVRGMDWLNGKSSAACALNLAYILCPKEIYLFGFDCRLGPNGELYWYPPYSWSDQKGGLSVKRLAQWAEDYKDYAEQFAAARIKVYTVGDWSAVTAFPRVSPKDIGCEL